MSTSLKSVIRLGVSLERRCPRAQSERTPGEEESGARGSFAACARLFLLASLILSPRGPTLSPGSRHGGSRATWPTHLSSKCYGGVYCLCTSLAPTPTWGGREHRMETALNPVPCVIRLELGPKSDGVVPDADLTR